MNSLIIYSSTDGHTKIISEKIRNNLKNSNNAELVSRSSYKFRPIKI